MPSYPFDLPGADLLTQLASQPYPALPQGIYVGREVFELSLSAWTPVTVAALYLVMSKTANARLKKRIAAHKAGQAPPPVDYIKGSQTLSQLVLAHNAFLALYSGWTFVHAVVRLVPYFWNGLAEGGLQGLSNAYCTVPTSDPAGLGRFIWLFYMSKYYEIVDSIILIAKGKKVSSLQSYHHSGAIAAMWAGARFSASALWIFLCFNSGIHTLMYSYYTASTLKLKFAGALKKTMTTAQITQLVVGCFVASMYLVVRYSPYAYSAGAVPSFAEAASSTQAWLEGMRNVILKESVKANATATVSSYNPATTALLLRDSLRQAASTNSQGLVSCCASTGQAFAVVFNVAYLLPLIFLFVQFYLSSYKKGSSKSNVAPSIKVEKAQ